MRDPVQARSGSSYLIASPKRLPRADQPDSPRSSIRTNF